MKSPPAVRRSVAAVICLELCLMNDLPFDEGYQSVPVNWGLSSERKRRFFQLLAEITGSRMQP